MQKTLVGLIVLLLVILGTAIAPLCAVSRGWAYYHRSNYAFGSGLQIWVILMFTKQPWRADSFTVKAQCTCMSEHASNSL